MGGERGVAVGQVVGRVDRLGVGRRRGEGQDWSTPWARAARRRGARRPRPPARRPPAATATARPSSPTATATWPRDPIRRSRPRPAPRPRGSGRRTGRRPRRSGRWTRPGCRSTSRRDGTSKAWVDSTQANSTASGDSTVEMSPGVAWWVTVRMNHTKPPTAHRASTGLTPGHGFGPPAVGDDVADHGGGHGEQRDGSGSARPRTSRRRSRSARP